MTRPAWPENGRHILPDMLQLAVPLYIQQLKDNGGPADADFTRLCGIGDSLAHQGDVLLFGGRKKGEAAQLFNDLAFAIAVLSFVPGGVCVFGQRWESIRNCGEECDGG